MMILASDGVWEFLSSQARTHAYMICMHICGMAIAPPAMRAALAAHTGAAVCCPCCRVLWRVGVGAGAGSSWVGRWGGRWVATRALLARQGVCDNGQP